MLFHAMQFHASDISVRKIQNGSHIHHMGSKHTMGSKHGPLQMNLRVAHEHARRKRALIRGALFRQNGKSQACDLLTMM